MGPLDRPTDGTQIDQTTYLGRSIMVPPCRERFWPFRRHTTLRRMSFEEPVPAWYGLTSLKDEALDTLRRHRGAGSLVAGERQQPDPTLSSGYRADVIGAILPLLDPPSGRQYVNWDREIEGRYAIPHQISLAIEDIFYALPPSAAENFSEAAFEAITVDMDLFAITGRIDVLRTELSAFWVRVGNVDNAAVETEMQEYASEFLAIVAAARPS